MAKTFEGAVFDKDFVLKKELRKLGFRQTDIDGEFYRIQDNIHADFTELFDSDVVEAKKRAKFWKNKVKKVLSRPVGKYIHKRRPHRNLFPMSVTGELADSVNVKVKETKDDIWSFTLSVNIKSNHANLTNDNITRLGRNVRKVAWTNWADDLMNGKPRKGVISARDLMRDLFR